MRLVLGIVLLGVMLVSQAGYAQMGCRAVQVTCAPELGMMSVRTLNYSSAHTVQGCEPGLADVQNLERQGIYSVTYKDAPLVTSSCNLEVGKVKVNVSSYVENKNEQGHCGGYGAIAIVSMWLDDKQLLKKVPIQTCATEPSYDADAVVFRVESDSYSVQFEGDVGEGNNYYSFRTQTHMPEGFPLPITKGMVLGRDQNTYGDY